MCGESGGLRISGFTKYLKVRMLSANRLNIQLAVQRAAPHKYESWMDE